MIDKAKEYVRSEAANRDYVTPIDHYLAGFTAALKLVEEECWWKSHSDPSQTYGAMETAERILNYIKQLMGE